MSDTFVIDKYGNKIILYRTGSDGFACAICGADIDAGDLVTGCNDCGAVICKDCAEKGMVIDHECEAEEE